MSGMERVSKALHTLAREEGAPSKKLPAGPPLVEKAQHLAAERYEAEDACVWKSGKPKGSRCRTVATPKDCAKVSAKAKCVGGCAWDAKDGECASYASCEQPPAEDSPITVERPRLAVLP